MLTSLVVLMTLAASPVQTGKPARSAPPARLVTTAKQVAPQFSRRNCTINYYHYKIFSLHVAGGYSLNLPLTVFIEDEAEPVAAAQPGDTVAVEQQSVFSMPLLRDVNLGYQSRDKAFFISWLKRFQRPRVQLYFKLWI